MNRFAASFFQFWNQAEQTTARRPWHCAILVTPLLFVLLAYLFPPAYETNDDPAISMIASGSIFCTTPDEHLIFSHPLIGLMLKHLYTQQPMVPWYALYLLATQVAAHIVITGLLFLYCPLRRALMWLTVWLGIFGIYFITHLQFTTTAFLAGMAGLLLLWEAANRVCARSLARKESAANQAVDATRGSATARPVLGLLLAGSALVLWCEMIRWYMFYLIVVMPLPALALWWFWKRPGWRITAQATVVAALVIVGGFGMKAWHLAYYHADPEWRDFYEYNELRAQFNDTIKVVYNEQTKDSFLQAGWSEIDMRMISSWCYDDPQVFSFEKMQKILQSRTWQVERIPLKTTLLEIYQLLATPELLRCLILHAILMLLVPLDRRHLSFNLVVLGTSFSMILLLSIIQKTPPTRVCMPIMVWSVAAIAWNIINRSLRSPNSAPAPSLWQVWQKFSERLTVARPAFDWARACCVVVPLGVLVLGLGRSIGFQYHEQQQRSVAQRQLFDQLHTFQPQASNLYVLWAASIPIENLNPLKTFHGLKDLRMLWFGWPQQMPAHRAMKARYGITNLMREWAEHPEVQVICPAICTEFYAKYVKTHYAQDVRAVPAGTLMGSPIFQFQKADGDVVAEKPRLVE